MSMRAYERLLRYVRFATVSDETSGTHIKLYHFMNVQRCAYCFC